MDHETLSATKALIARAGSLHPAPLQASASQARNGHGENGKSDLTVRDESHKIIGYYDPHSLTEEYDAPVLQEISYATGVPIIKGKPFWERLPNEDTQNYELFSHFRNQELPRILNNTADHFNVEPEVVDVISQLWLWAERVETYDKYADELLHKERARRIVIMEGNHSKAAKELFKRALDILSSFTETDYTPGQAVALLKQAAELERLANKLPKDEPMEIYDAKNANKNSDIRIDGEGQKVQINFTRDWNPG